MAKKAEKIDPLQQLFDESARENEQTQRELKEIDLLIQQTTTEVERLVQRNAQSTNRVRQLEASLDTVPREDLKDAYSRAMDAQQRLFTMRGQLEKFQSDQRNMQRYSDLLRRLVETGGHASAAARAGEPGSGEQSMVARIIEAQERERQKLGRQMHDGPAQALTNLILQAEICSRLLDTDTDRARVELANLKNAVSGTFRKVKDFIFALRPMMLDDLGLVPTLRRYVDGFAEISGLSINLSITGKDRRLPAYREVTIFRVIQELLNNANDYAHASGVQVSLDMGESQVRGSVEDNGSGFDLNEALTSPDADRLGLATIRDRVQMLGGQLQCDSGLGRGTKVSFELPTA